METEEFSRRLRKQLGVKGTLKTLGRGWFDLIPNPDLTLFYAEMWPWEIWVEIRFDQN